MEDTGMAGQVREQRSEEGESRKRRLSPWMRFIIGGILYSPGPNQLPWIVFTIGTTVVGIAQIWLGYALWSGQRERAPMLAKEAQRVV